MTNLKYSNSSGNLWFNRMTSVTGIYPLCFSWSVALMIAISGILYIALIVYHVSIND